MLMTTVLLYEFIEHHISRAMAILMSGFFLTIETVFFLASVVKFVHGGYVTFIILMLILGVMYVWYFSNIRP